MKSLIITALFFASTAFSFAQDSYDLVSTKDFTTVMKPGDFNLCSPPEFGISIPFSKVSKLKRITINQFYRKIGEEEWTKSQSGYLNYWITDNKSEDGKSVNCHIVDIDYPNAFFYYDMCDEDKYEWHMKREYKLAVYTMKSTNEFEEYWDDMSESWKKREIFVKDKLMGETQPFKFEMPREKLMDITRQDRWNKFQLDTDLSSVNSNIREKLNGDYSSANMKALFSFYNSKMSEYVDNDDFETAKLISEKIDSIEGRKQFNQLYEKVTEAESKGEDVTQVFLNFEYEKKKK